MTRNLIKRDTKDLIYGEEWTNIYERTGGALNVINKLKEYHLERGLEDSNGKDTLSQVEMRKVYQLILEIRYLENKGNARVVSDFENSASNNCQGWVGTYDEATNSFTDGKLDTKFKSFGSGSEFWLSGYYLRLFAWDRTANKPDARLVIKNVKEGKDDLLEGLETKEKFELYLENYEGLERLLGLDPIERKIVELIKKELKQDTNETAQDWTNELRAINGLSGISIDETYKTEWTSLPNQKFEKVDKVEALIKEVLDSDKKVKSDFIEKAKQKKASLTNLAEVMKEKPKEIIALIESYKYDNLDDSAKNEKDKKKTQMKRRIAVALNKSKESDLIDSNIPENLAKIRIGELTIDETKSYDANLKEITTEIPHPQENNSAKPFLRWSNPWIWVIAVILVGTICAIVWWDKIKSLFEESDSDKN